MKIIIEGYYEPGFLVKKCYEYVLTHHLELPFCNNFFMYKRRDFHTHWTPVNLLLLLYSFIKVLMVTEFTVFI